MYEYRATITRVIDGDTVEALVDLGFGVLTDQTFRLYGINAPETRGESRDAGKAATEYLRLLIDKHTGNSSTLTIQTHKDRQEKYGRYLAVLVANGMNLNVGMINAGHAVPYMEDVV